MKQKSAIPFQRRREVQLEAALTGGADGQPDEILSFSPPDKQRDRWIARTMQAFNTTLSTLREEIFSGIAVRRHWRVLDINPGGGLLTLEALRRVPEGGVWAAAESEQEKNLLEGVLSSLPELERPNVFTAEAENCNQLRRRYTVRTHRREESWDPEGKTKQSCGKCLQNSSLPAVSFRRLKYYPLTDSGFPLFFRRRYRQG